MSHALEKLLAVLSPARDKLLEILCILQLKRGFLIAFEICTSLHGDLLVSKDTCLTLALRS